MSGWRKGTEVEQAKGMEDRRLGKERRGEAKVIVRKVRLRMEDVECERFSYIFNDACFPPKWDDRIQIKTSSSDKIPSACSDIRRFLIYFNLPTQGGSVMLLSRAELKITNE